MSTKAWGKDELHRLYSLHHNDNKPFPEIAKILGRSSDCVCRKYKRMDWDDYMKNPDVVTEPKPWTHAEMCQLYAYIQAKQSYPFISEKLVRSVQSVESKAQKTDWQAWSLAVGQNTDKELDVNDEKLVEQLVDALVALSRHDTQRLSSISKEEFSRKINFDHAGFPIDYSVVQSQAMEKLHKIGLGNPETVELGEGTYIIVGDSHGKFTRTKMFRMLQEVNGFIKPDKIIHIGHIVDDDNDISWEWGNFKNLIVLAKKEELQSVQQQRNTFNFTYDIVRGCITIGKDLVVMNQDLINDYTKTPISSIDQEIVDNKVITNCHRLEFAAKCTDEGKSYYASPGCLCERHIVKTIRQIDFDDNRIVKYAAHDGFVKYRRMEHLNCFWKHGMMVVRVDAKGNHTVIPCLIRKINNEYVTSYFDKIITTSGVREPDTKTFVHGDMHSPSHDAKIIDIQEQICRDYAPDTFVNVGDAHDFRSLNHHEMEQHRVIFADILQESAVTHYILKRMASWARESHIIVGNHERFSSDFIAQFPQFRSYLDFSFMCNLESIGYKVTNLKDVLKIRGAKYLHGEMKMFGQSGNRLEKASRTCGENVFIGHVHTPGIRFGCYSVGCACNLDQGYNEPNCSTWMHGFGMNNTYKGKNFPTVVAIIDYRCILGDKQYEPVDPSGWKVNKFKAQIVYDYKK